MRTAHFDEALAFYTSAIGLTLGALDAQAGTSRLRARLLDAEGNAVFELLETDAPPATLAHELAFGMPLRSWQLLRARLDNAGIAYRAAGTTLYLHDVDGTPLRLESIADGHAG
ncbi:MAG: VOC family protein [Rubricoccaceae bacterium]